MAAGHTRVEPWMDDAEKAQARKGLCVWQTGYGLPWTEYCKKKATHGPFCREHWQDNLELKYVGNVVFAGGKAGKVIRVLSAKQDVIDAKGRVVHAEAIPQGKEARDARDGRLLGKRLF